MGHFQGGIQQVHTKPRVGPNVGEVRTTHIGEHGHTTVQDQVHTAVTLHFGVGGHRCLTDMALY